MDLNPESIAIIVAGVLLCFAGWHLFRFSRYIIGFILGASIGYALSVIALKTFEKPFPPSWEPWVVLVATVIFALLGILLLKVVIKTALFIAGFLFGNMLVAVYLGGMKVTAHSYSIEVLIQNISIWSIAAGLVCGILFVLFEKGFVILYTCAVGAYLVTIRMGAPPTVFYALLLVGSFAQLWMSRGSRVKDLQIAQG